MAIVTNNDITLGLRGRIGKYFVFRSLRGKTVASRAPKKPDPRKQSAAQRQTRNMFKEAAAWAVHTLLDPQQKHFYQERAKKLALPNAYTAAVRDYMRNSTKTEESKGAPTSVHVNKPVFVSIRNGKPMEAKNDQPNEQARPIKIGLLRKRPEGITGIRIPHVTKVAVKARCEVIATGRNSIHHLPDLMSTNIVQPMRYQDLLLRDGYSNWSKCSQKNIKMEDWFKVERAASSLCDRSLHRLLPRNVVGGCGPRMWNG